MLRLEKITRSNAEQALRLEVHPHQREFVASNDWSLIEAYLTVAANGAVFPFGLYEGETAVGFLMIGYGVDEDWQNPPEIARNSYNLWRLMIDRRYQHQGYGKQAVKLALDFIRTFPCGPADWCWLSYEPENGNAQKLYASFGFRETGEMDGEEKIAVLPLNGGEGKENDRL